MYRVNCRKCSATILVTTAEARSELCMPCFKRDKVMNGYHDLNSDVEYFYRSMRKLKAIGNMNRILYPDKVIMMNLDFAIQRNGYFQ